MNYFDIKTLHIFGACLFVAFSFGANFYLILRSNGEIPDKFMLQQVLSMQLFLGLPLAMVQLLTGFFIMALKPYSFITLWVWGTFASFLVLMGIWLASLFSLKQTILQISKVSWRRWKRLSGAAVLVLVGMLFLMANRIG